MAEYGVTATSLMDPTELAWRNEIMDGTFLDGTAGTELPSSGEGFMDYFNKNSKGLGTMAGLAGLGFNAYNSLFGQGKKEFDKKMELYNQQIASNQQAIDQRKKLNDAWATHGAGLAGSTQKVG